MENNIKSITKTNCPSCKETFYVEFEMPPTTLSEVFTQEQMDEAKQEVMRELNSLGLEKEQIDNVISWVTNKETVFGPNEVPFIIKSLTENK